MKRRVPVAYAVSREFQSRAFTTLHYWTASKNTRNRQHILIDTECTRHTGQAELNSVSPSDTSQPARSNSSHSGGTAVRGPYDTHSPELKALLHTSTTICCSSTRVRANKPQVIHVQPRSPILALIKDAMLTGSASYDVTLGCWVTLMQV